MNRIPKLVASHTLENVDAWANSSLIGADLIAEVRRQSAERDGIGSIVRELAAHDLVDEYRLLVFPTVLGHGARLFPEDTAPTDLQLASIEKIGDLALMCYERIPRD